MEIKPATRQGVRPLIAFYSESGCGKTYSSLLLARGLAGPSGRIVIIDTESGRGSLYADVIPGGYLSLELTEPFSPGRYIEAITIAEKDAACVVIDSMSHEWDGGPGCILDMAMENEQRSGKAGLHNWKLPKLEHAKLVQKLLRSAVPVICCLRAKYKSRQTRENGKTAIVKDDFTSPIQAEDFIFEMTVHGEIMPDHSFRLTKCSHPALKDCFPTKGPITIQHGELLAKWCANPLAGATKQAPVDPQIATVESLKKQLWKATEAIHVKDHKAGSAELEQWLLSQKILNDGESLKTLSAERLAEVIDKAEIAINDVMP